jgi:hypothetical protein
VDFFNELTYSSVTCTSAIEHIAQQVRCGAKGVIPQNEAGVRIDSRTGGKVGQQDALFNKGGLLGCKFKLNFFVQIRQIIVYSLLSFTVFMLIL